ncbi:hypothetical protein CEXT_761041 [Caerostris extrusa]|uniref:Uncharacterized protein n=1 Tax=Caerostris extrusa TaxID=172846 RepID=A0AAV4ME71_CAEEX|nr:hypothetical protein CEXT_761041 [Caerostris extrusa]
MGSRRSGEACSELTIGTSRARFSLIKRLSLNVPTFKSIIGDLDYPISLEGKGNTWDLSIIPGVSGRSFHSCWFEIFILEQISEKLKESFDICTEVPSLPKRSAISLPYSPV